MTIDTTNDDHYNNDDLSIFEKDTVEVPVKYLGTVKWFNDRIGFGFIECAELTQDVFVHYKNVDPAGQSSWRSLDVGAAVLFELGTPFLGGTHVALKVVQL